MRIRSVIRQEDTVARFGGDEFVVLLSRVRDGSVAALVAANLIARMNEPMQAGPHTLRVTTSVGVAVWPSDGADAESLIRNADHALYQAKDQGRNCYRLFAAAMNDRAPRRLSLEQSLLKAIEASGFSLVYQPQFDLRSSSLVGYEALVRWNDWGLGHVAPASFIPVAEEIRVIDSIGAWVLDRALQDAGRFAAGARLAINVSAVQLRDRVFPKRLSTLLNTHGFPAERLELELAESATLAGDEAVGAVLTELRGQGVRIAIDDFGRGYASLAQLRRLPADLVKIDQTFIAGVDKSPADSALVLGMIGLAHGLGLTVVAKGVETEAQRDFLHAAGCDFAQGFLLGRPLPLEELGR